MKRLRRKKSALVVRIFEAKRRTRRKLIFAEWVSGDINDANLVQQITDMMATGGQMQIEYNGEWKTIEPYGWNSSQEGNVLLMCYKDTGEVRSYRLDRMTNVQFDSDVMDLSQYGLVDENESGEPAVEEIDGVEVPVLEEDVNTVDNVEEAPFDEAIDALESVDEQYLIEDWRQRNNTQELEPASIDDFNPVDDEQLQENY